MKKVLMTMTLLLALTMGMQAASQKHRHTPRPQEEELVDSTSKDVVEVYSDTTSSAQAPAAVADDDWDEWDDEDNLNSAIKQINKELGSEGVAGLLFVLAVLFIIFVLAPVLIIAALFYFINRNRKQRLKMAQMAAEQGQPIPERLLEAGPANAEEEYQKGLRQFFVGVGLMIFLGYAAGEIGFGIGALVACIGLGKIAASKLGNKNPLNTEH